MNHCSSHLGGKCVTTSFARASTKTLLTCIAADVSMLRSSGSKLYPNRRSLHSLYFSQALAGMKTRNTDRFFDNVCREHIINMYQAKC